jgi:hypothetical protein
MTSPQPSKQGAALLFVLAILALLSALAITFTLQMRTERLAGRAFLNRAQGLHLLDSALARAMSDIEAAIPADQYYPPETPLYPPRAPSDRPLNLNLTTELSYLPGMDLLQEQAIETALERAGWELIQDDQGTIIGRISFLAVNSSGLLDANAIGGVDASRKPLPRLQGEHPGEIQLTPTLLSELNPQRARFPQYSAARTTTNVAAALLYNRDHAWRRFESIRELRELNQITPPHLITSTPLHFSTYSLYPRNSADESPWIDLSLGTNLSYEAFAAGMARANLPPETAIEDLYASYLDYCDADSIPSSTKIPCTEKVPMYNEVWLENLAYDLSIDSELNLTIEWSGSLFIETWYPYPPPYGVHTNFFTQLYGSTPNQQNRALGKSLTYSGADQAGVDPDGFIELLIDEQRYLLGFPVQMEEKASFSSGPFWVYQYDFDVSHTLGPPPANSSSTIDITKAGIGIGAMELFHRSGKHASTPIDKTEALFISAAITNNRPFSSNLMVGISCIDPRINHDATDTEQWTLDAKEITPAAFNLFDDALMGEEAGSLTQPTFFVRNGPMKNAAELGALSIGKPWRTIRLYAGDDLAELNPVLDFFHAGEPILNADSAPGLVNINTSRNAPLASALYQTSLSPLPNHESLTLGRLSARQALDCADYFISNRQNHGARSISQLGEAFNFSDPEHPLYAPSRHWNDTTKESLIANSYRLFGWRDTLYSIILIAQPLAGVSENQPIKRSNIQSTQKAVVYVWRDPLTRKSAIVFYGRDSSLDSSAINLTDLLQAFRPD